MLITPARPSDIESIAHLVNSAYRGESAEQGWSSEAKVLGGQRIDADMLAETLSGGKTTLLLMRDHEDGHLAGCVSLEPTSEASIWYLSMLTIDPTRQDEGLGRRLLSQAEDYLQAHGAKQVKISVIWLREGLIQWYERRGYRQTGQTEPFPYGNERFGVPFRDDLYFLVLEKSLI